MSLQFIVWEDWEGNNGNSVPTEDEMMLTHFRRMTLTTTMTETSRDNEHDKNVMVQLMFGTLCPPEDEACPRGRRCRRRSAASQSANCQQQPRHRAGGVDPSDKTRTDLGCIFLQESSGILCFLFLWPFFHKNHDSCSAVTFMEPPQESSLYGA